MAKTVFILGAGASTDFFPISYGEGTPLNNRSLIPFPATNNYIQQSIKFGKLSKDSPIFEFISERYKLGFEALRDGAPLDIEKVYRDIYELSESVDMENDPRGTGRAWALLFTIQDIIRELPQHYSTIYGPCMNYSVFAQHIVETGSAAITLNWDTFLDEALFNTGKWYYESGYGFKFKKIYLDRVQIDSEERTSPTLLLKPHGSVNWFRYRDHYSSATNGFTNETVRDEDRAETFLMLFSKDKAGIHPIHRRLNMAKEWSPPLKMSCGLDIVYPNKTTHSMAKRTNYTLIRSKMKALLSEADEMVFIGFALKDQDANEFGDIKIKETAAIILVNPDNTKEFNLKYQKEFKVNKVIFASEKTFKEYCKSLTDKNKTFKDNNLSLG